MDKYQRVRDDAFKLAHEEMMVSLTDEQLLKAVEALKADPTASFGYIRNLTQEQVSDLFPLIVDGTWCLKESYFCDEWSFKRYRAYLDDRNPKFVDVEAYKAWIDLCAKYPQPLRFNTPEGRKARDEYERQYDDFWGDARLFDGRAHLRFGKITIAPGVKGLHSWKAHDPIAEDELFLVLDVEADANTQEEDNKERPGICYVLTPNKETFEERRLELYRHFKKHIIHAYIKKLLRHHDEKMAEKWKNELMDISDEIIG